MKGDPEVLILPAFFSFSILQDVNQRVAGKTVLYHAMIYFQENVGEQQFIFSLWVVFLTESIYINMHKLFVPLIQAF